MKKIKKLTELKEKTTIGNFRLKKSEKTKRKMSISHKGKHHSEETKQKMRNKRIGDNCGGYETRFKMGHKISKELKEKLSIALIKWRKNNIHPVFFKGHKLINGGNTGHHHSEESKQKISKSNKGKGHSEEWKNKVREDWKRPEKKLFMKNVRARQIFPIKDTSIEVKLQNFLKQLGIEFFTHQYMKIEHGYQCDILIPSMNTIIECFGNYWHKIPYGNLKDSLRCQELREKGFRVLVFWENEIKVMELNDLREKLYETNN